MSRRYFASPFIVWIAAGTVIPLIMIAYYGFTDRSGAFTIENVVSIMGAEHAQALWLALLLALISTAICFVLAFPLALILKDSRLGTKGFMIFIFVLPMWMNFLLRTYAWMTILENNGLINKMLMFMGLSPVKLINTQAAVLIGMVYNYLPFMILPLYSVMTKIHQSLIEASQDLGADSFNVFSKVIFPLSLPGMAAGVTMVFVAAVSTFVISRMLGGASNILIGDLIEMQFLGMSYNPNLGSAISLVLIVISLCAIMLMQQIDDEDEDVKGMFL